MLLTRLHLLMAKIGISPKVGDPVIGAVGLAVADLIAYGNLDLTGVRVAVAGVVLAALGLSAPPAHGVSQADVEQLAASSGKRRGAHALH